MWVVFAKVPLPDVAYWPGRKLLGVVDALAWPVAIVVALSLAPVKTGIVLPVAGIFLVILAVARAHTAVFYNQRYRFTTWRIGKTLVLLLLIGLAFNIGTAWQ